MTRRRLTVSDLNHRGGLGLIGERGATSDDRRPNLTNNNRAGWDFDSLGNIIRASVEVDDLASPVLVENSLDCCAVVGYTITLSALGFDGNKL
jgi:hypothetical protein